MRWIVAAVLGLLAAGNWSSRWRRDDRLELWTKPAVTLAVIVFAVMSPAEPASAQWWCVAALVACLVGDVALLPRFDRFEIGVAAFALGHVLFLVCGLTIGVDTAAAVVAALVAGILLFVVGQPIARGAGAMRVPVSIYFVAIGAMATVLAGTARPWMIVGAAAFMTSDAILGWNRFVRPLAWSPVAIMATYHTALVAITLGLSNG